MELILKQDVENLGFKDDIVTVKNGYGRNFLIPQGQAVMATVSAKKVLAETLKQRAFKEKKYCRFKRSGIKYIDYKDPDFLQKFVNEQGKILPRRLTGTSLKYQRKVSVAVKRARHLALMPYVADLLK